MPVHGVQEDTGIRCEGVQGNTPARQGRDRTGRKKKGKVMSALSVTIVQHIQAASSKNCFTVALEETVRSQMDFFSCSSGTLPCLSEFVASCAITVITFSYLTD